MKRHGCIDESDTELLQEMFELLELSEPLKLLNEYQRKFRSVFDLSQSHPAAWLQSPKIEAQLHSSPVTSIGHGCSLSVDRQSSSFWRRSVFTVAMFLYRACTNLVYSQDEPQESCDSTIHRDGNHI